jgi:hypothetical protein
MIGQSKKEFVTPELDLLGADVADVTLDELENVKSSKPSVYTVHKLRYYYRISFPDSMSQLRLKKIKTATDEYSYFVCVLVDNYTLSWMSIGSLYNICDYEGCPIKHSVSEYLEECTNDAERILAMLGKSIRPGEDIQYKAKRRFDGKLVDKVTPHLEFL